MIQEIINSALQSYSNLFGNSHIVVAVLIALLFLYLLRNELSFNPFVLIMAPLGLLGAAIGYVVAMAKEKKSKWVYLFAIFLCAFFIFQTGDRFYSQFNSQRVENAYHIPNDYVEVMDYVLSLSDDKSISVLAMPDYCMYHRIYSGRFQMMYEKRTEDDVRYLSEDKRNAFTELSGRNPDMKIVSEAADNSGCEYVILKRDHYWPMYPLDKYDYEIIHETDGWSIYGKKGDKK